MKRRRIKRNRRKFYRFVKNTPPIDILIISGELVADYETVVAAIQGHIEKKIARQYFY